MALRFSQISFFINLGAFWKQNSENYDISWHVVFWQKTRSWSIKAACLTILVLAGSTTAVGYCLRIVFCTQIPVITNELHRLLDFYCLHMQICNNFSQVWVHNFYCITSPYLILPIITTTCSSCLCVEIKLWKGKNNSVRIHLFLLQRPTLYPIPR